MLLLSIVLGFLCLAAVFGITAVIVSSHSAQQNIVGKALRLAENALKEAYLLSRSQQEAATKYTTANAQTANLISEKIDQRVRERIKVMNAKPGQMGSLEAIEDAPPMPSVYQSGMIDDLSEIERENSRPRKMEFEYNIRDTDYAHEEV